MLQPSVKIRGIANYRITVLPYYRITVLPYYRITVLPYYRITPSKGLAMSRASFFSNVSPNEFTTSTSPGEESPSPSNISTSNTTQALESKAAISNNNVKGNKRIAYTIKIDPAIRKDIKDWALKNDATISSVIETLARLYLKDLKKEDISL